MIAHLLLVTVVVAAMEPLPAGAPAPHDGVLMTVEEAEDVIRVRAERDALRTRLEEEIKIREAWAALAKTPAAAPSAGPFDNAEFNRTVGFIAGVVVTVGAIVAGAWITGVAGDVSGAGE